MAEAVDYKQIGSRPVRPDGLDKVQVVRNSVPIRCCRI